MPLNPKITVEHLELINEKETLFLLSSNGNGKLIDEVDCHIQGDSNSMTASIVYAMNKHYEVEQLIKNSVKVFDAFKIIETCK